MNYEAKASFIVYYLLMLCMSQTRICASVFTSLSAAIQVCLNGEPILTLQPESNDSAAEINAGKLVLKDDRSVMRYSFIFYIHLLFVLV